MQPVAAIPIMQSPPQLPQEPVQPVVERASQFAKKGIEAIGIKIKFLKLLIIFFNSTSSNKITNSILWTFINTGHTENAEMSIFFSYSLSI